VLGTPAAAPDRILSPYNDAPLTLGDIEIDNHGDDPGFFPLDVLQAPPGQPRFPPVFQRMPAKPPKLQYEPPPHSMSRSSSTTARISYTDAGTLKLDFPATGWNAHATVAGAFSLAWFGALLPATTSLAAAPILLPFYLAGGLVAKSALVEPFTSTTVSIGEFGWSVQRSVYGRVRKEWSGATRNLRGATVVDRSTVFEGEVRYRYELVLLLSNDSKPITIGTTFRDFHEAEHLARTIQEQLQTMRRSANEGADGGDIYL